MKLIFQALKFPCGAEELTYFTMVDYVGHLVGLAKDIQRLLGYREGLWEMLLGSAICDAERFVVSLQDVLKNAWETALRSGG